MEGTVRANSFERVWTTEGEQKNETVAEKESGILQKRANNQKHRIKEKAGKGKSLVYVTWFLLGGVLQICAFIKKMFFFHTISLTW